jgi:hypothetical protein
LVDPVDHAVLKFMLPGDVAGLKQNGLTSEKTAMVEGRYNNDQGSNII